MRGVATFNIALILAEGGQDKMRSEWQLTPSPRWSIRTRLAGRQLLSAIQGELDVGERSEEPQEF